VSEAYPPGLLHQDAPRRPSAGSAVPGDSRALELKVFNALMQPDPTTAGFSSPNIDRAGIAGLGLPPMRSRCRGLGSRDSVLARERALAPA